MTDKPTKTGPTTPSQGKHKRTGPGSGKAPPPIVLNSSMIGKGGVGGDAPKRGGRATIYSEEAAEAICTWLTEGKSLLAYCKQDGTPARATVFNWLDANPSFAMKFSQARDRGIDAVAELAHDAATENLPPDQVPSARLAFDARRWFVAKLAPSRYGDRVNLKAEVSGPGGGPLTVQAIALIDILSSPERLAERLPQLTDEQLQALNDALPALLAAPSSDQQPIERESAPVADRQR